MGLAMPQKAFVRKYNPDTDFDAVVQVFRETCDESLKVEPIWTVGSYIWCRPYLFLSPGTCFVVDDGNGTAVGYIIGVAHSADFCERWLQDYVHYIDPELTKTPACKLEDEDEHRDTIHRANKLAISIRGRPRKLVLGDYEEETNLGILLSCQGARRPRYLSWNGRLESWCCQILRVLRLQATVQGTGPRREWRARPDGQE
jgi:hypothetical protein